MHEAVIENMDTAFIEDVNEDSGFNFRLAKHAQLMGRLAKMSCRTLTKKLTALKKNKTRESVAVKGVKKIELDVVTSRIKRHQVRSQTIPRRYTSRVGSIQSIDFNRDQFANIGDIVCCYI